MIGFWSWPRLFTRNCANWTSFIIASFLVFLEKVSSVFDLKIMLMLTQKQIAVNQVTMGLVHLLFSFEQPMMKVKNFLQSHPQTTSLMIQKNWYLCLLNILQSKIYTLHNLDTFFFWLCIIDRVFILRYTSYWRVAVAHHLCKKSLVIIIQLKYLSPWMGCVYHRNVAYKLHHVSTLSFHYYEIRLALLICKFVWCNWIWNALQS